MPTDIEMELKISVVAASELGMDHVSFCKLTKKISPSNLCIYIYHNEIPHHDQDPQTQHMYSS